MYFILDLCLAQAHIQYKYDHGGRLNFYQFKGEVCRALMRDRTSVVATTPVLRSHILAVGAPGETDLRNPISEQQRTDRTDHWVKFGSIKHSQHCKLPKCKSRIKSYCTKCRVYLCTTKNCFLDWHTLSAEAIQKLKKR